MRILLGYMGCGKSTIAKTLSKTIRFRLLIWMYISKKKAGLSINAILNNMEKSKKDGA
jgi:shikimate kinase